MKLLDLPEFKNIDQMQRKDIIKVINSLNFDGANKRRVEFILLKGRTAKQLVKLLSLFDRYSHYNQLSCGEDSVGDEAGFITKSYIGMSVKFSQKYGRIFAISDSCLHLYYRGDIVVVNC